MTVRYRDEDPKDIPTTELELEAGFKRLGDGFLAGYINDPTHDGDRHGLGATYEFDGEGGRLYRRRRGSQ